MNLHRTTNKPDWQTVKPTERNYFQKIAAATRGVVTPANIITMIGLGLVIYGLVAVLNQQYWLGLITLGIGRLLDIADGAAAQATGTKSPLGEFLDAAIDKVGTLLTIIVLFVGQIGAWWAIGLILLPQVIIPLVILYKRRQGTTVHPTRIGKLSMAATWVVIVGFILAKATQLPAHSTAEMVLYILSAVAFGLGSYALGQYLTNRD